MKHKFAIIGTSCAGKTTLTHALVARLKSYGILADGVFSQDRKFSFPLSQIESEDAQNWMVANIIAKEADLFLHNDIEVLISDRSPLDLLAYYVYQHDTPLSKAATNYAIEWCKGYTALYYLDPLPYQDDGKRPPDAFRLGVDETLRQLVDQARLAGVTVLSGNARNEVLADVLKRAGRRKPGVKAALGPTDIQRLANELGYPVAAKPQRADADVLSDTDLWVCAPVAVRAGTTQLLVDKARSALRGHVGPWPAFDVLVCSTFDGIPACTVYQPQPTPPLLLDGDAFFGVEQEGPFKGKRTLFIRGALATADQVLAAADRLSAEQIYFGSSRLSEIDWSVVDTVLSRFNGMVTAETGSRVPLDTLAEHLRASLLHLVLTPVMFAGGERYSVSRDTAVYASCVLERANRFAAVSVKHDIGDLVTYVTVAKGDTRVYTNTIGCEYAADTPVSL